jgi:hypothetical protein
LLVPRASSTPVAAWSWPTWVVSRIRVLEVVFILLEPPSPSRRIFIGSHSLPPSGSLYRSFNKNCVDPKMAAYCQAVRDLEGKFHVLELHHVLCDYNKAADVLTKAASSRSPVPHGVFASDQHQPSVREEGEKPPEESEPEVMAIYQPPEVNLKVAEWRFPILEWLVEGKLPRPDGSPVHRPPSESICPHRWRTLQAWGSWHTHAVHPQGSRPRAITRNTCRHLRSPRRSEKTCRESFLIRFLLAHSGCRLKGHHAAL